MANISGFLFPVQHSLFDLELWMGMLYQSNSESCISRSV